MNIALSPEQLQAIDAAPGGLPHLTDPRTKTEYVLVPVDQYDSVRDAMEDQRRQQAVRRVAGRNAVGRAGDEP